MDLVRRWTLGFDCPNGKKREFTLKTMMNVTAAVLALAAGLGVGGLGTAAYGAQLGNDAKAAIPKDVMQVIVRCRTRARR